MIIENGCESTHEPRSGDIYVMPSAFKLFCAMIFYNPIMPSALLFHYFIPPDSN